MRHVNEYFKWCKLLFLKLIFCWAYICCSSISILFLVQRKLNPSHLWTMPLVWTRPSSGRCTDGSWVVCTLRCRHVLGAAAPSCKTAEPFALSDWRRRSCNTSSKQLHYIELCAGSDDYKWGLFIFIYSTLIPISILN